MQQRQLRRLASRYLYGRERHRSPSEGVGFYCPRVWQLRKTNATGRYEGLKGGSAWNNRHLIPNLPPPPSLQA